MAPERRTLRFITCGSVDDGKSTLIGRLLHESKSVFDDQMAALENDSRQYGTQGEQIDFALLVDGLQAEREQGITIDVAYRFFATEKRRFIVADTPGHEQYTRNMATGASTADLAVILVDARQGVLPQTKRHAFIASLLGIRHVVGPQGVRGRNPDNTRCKAVLGWVPEVRLEQGIALTYEWIAAQVAARTVSA